MTIKPTKLFWKKLEKETNAKPDALMAALQFNADGLLPVVTQCAQSHQVLMLAWMNKDSLLQTLNTGMMVYFSRSRQSLWKKGETSGCYQKWISLTVDCDGDTLLAQVLQTDHACHTRRRSCFYINLIDGSISAH